MTDAFSVLCLKIALMPWLSCGKVRVINSRKVVLLKHPRIERRVLARNLLARWVLSANEPLQLAFFTYFGILTSLSRAELLFCSFKILNCPLLRYNLVRSILRDKILERLKAWISLRLFEECVTVRRVVTSTHHELLKPSFLTHPLVILVLGFI
jgi:hypothetical protein